MLRKEHIKIHFLPFRKDLFNVTNMTVSTICGAKIAFKIEQKSTPPMWPATAVKLARHFHQFVNHKQTHTCHFRKLLHPKVLSYLVKVTIR